MEGNSNSIQSLRKEYSSQGLSESQVGSDPFELFKNWFDEAVDAKIQEPNAMSISTCSKDGKPSSRIVLIKEFDHRGFVFYTNYESRKGQEIAANPFVSLVFWWGDLQRQIRIEGKVQKTSEEESRNYFSTRPRDARIGAWASRQSTVLSSRTALDTFVQEFTEKFKNETDIPPPPYWGGFRVVPSSIEFWKGRTNRLHDRIVFERKEDDEHSWNIRRYSP